MMAEGDRKARVTRCRAISRASVSAWKFSGISRALPDSSVGSTRPEPGPVSGMPSMFTSCPAPLGRLKSMAWLMRRTLSRYLRCV